MRNWKEIWDNKAKINGYIHEALIKADGFDLGAGSFSLENWLEYTGELIAILRLQEHDSIYDVGCGSGAFVYPLYIRGHKVGGVDCSETLIEFANKVMPKCDFSQGEAALLNVDNKFDVVVSHSVFQYFPSLNYAEDAIVRMLGKANRLVAIFDINDKSKESVYHEIRKGAMSQEEYDEKYSGLQHLCL